ncbi:DUF4251 domain-containing protein [Psychroserpens burtonensis]|uniref:DUF4251 domain-containing protein n=1 Tax=Psychroserpens burtonensis TaxID=49278 RepID=A0A5C7BD51_9FLAO|nr:DUF4251 domain-containing protein [Psychroserpens burtonensis]TXE20384.1 DUF4251 domain-containing protein [Psychroserpens burtonensis]
MKLNYTFVFLFSVIIMSCSASKIEATPEQIKILDDLVAEQSFVIESDWALPQSTGSLMMLQNAGFLAPGDSASRISLIGNQNELRLKNDVLSSKLPYFGEVQSNTGYNGSDGSISFDGEMKGYKVIKNGNSSYTITFDARSHSENFDVTIHLYPNLRSDIILKGAKRFPIRYTGYVSPILE